MTPGKPKQKAPRLVSPVDKQGKVLAKLAAYANTQVKEEKIVGQDNEEYVYRYDVIVVYHYLKNIQTVNLLIQPIFVLYCKYFKTSNCFATTYVSLVVLKD